MLAVLKNSFCLAGILFLTVISSACVDVPCNPRSPEECLYEAKITYTDTAFDSTLHDPNRNYDIPIKVRYPVGATTPQPIVIWHHGGEPSLRAHTRSEDWGILLAQAGYIVIHPARAFADVESVHDKFEAICIENEAASFGSDEYTFEEACAAWVVQHLYGPQNTHFIIDNLHLIEAMDPALSGLLDTSRIALGGHSAGSGISMVNAGAKRQFVPGGTIFESEDDRPMAFLLASALGTTTAGWPYGFTTVGYMPIDRPLMVITGAGDGIEASPEARTAVWLNAQPGDNWFTWDRDPRAIHETMDLNKCEPPVPMDHCAWLGSVGLAFLDAKVRGETAAIDWLNSDALSILTDGIIEVNRR